MAVDEFVIGTVTAFLFFWDSEELDATSRQTRQGQAISEEMTYWARTPAAAADWICF